MRTCTAMTKYNTLSNRARRAVFYIALSSSLLKQWVKQAVGQC